MKLHHSKYKENYRHFILECLQDVEGFTRQQKIECLTNRINSEYGHLLKRYGRRKTIAEWLQGIAIDIPFYKWEIIELAKKMGSVNDNLTEKQEDNIIENYWDFMAERIIELEREVA